MYKNLSHTSGAGSRISLAVRFLLLTASVAVLGTVSFAQTPSNVTSTVSMLTEPSAGLVAPVIPVKKPAFSLKAPSKPMPQAAGGDHQGYVVAKAYVFHVHRSNDDVAVINANGGGNITSVDTFNFGMETAYKLEGGWNATNNFGVRGSFFYTSQAAQENRTGSATAPFFISPRPLNVTFTGSAAAGTLARFREVLRMPVVDVEGTYKWHSSTNTILVSAGVRIAPTRQTYTAEDVFVTTPENLRYSQRRTGVGPTFGIDLRHKLGSSNFWLTGAGRVAVLFGRINETATFISGGFTQTATRKRSRTSGNIEGEFGLEWNHNIGPNQIFINGSFAAHHWIDLVNVVPVSVVGGSATALLDNPTLAPTQKGSILLAGGSFSFGFRF